MKSLDPQVVAAAIPAVIHALLPVIRDWEADKRVGVYLVGPMLCFHDEVIFAGVQKSILVVRIQPSRAVTDVLGG